jgi:hypothetical protein
MVHAGRSDFQTDSSASKTKGTDLPVRDGWSDPARFFTPKIEFRWVTDLLSNFGVGYRYFTAPSSMLVDRYCSLRRQQIVYGLYMVGIWFGYGSYMLACFFKSTVIALPHKM